MRWLLVIASLFIFTIFTTTRVQGGWTVGAILPNPVGSDTQEWVWLRRDDLEPNVDTDWWLRDVIGTPRVASLAGMLSGQWVIVTASQSGVALNNTGDQIELWWGSQQRQLTPLYPTAAEGQVWTEKEGEWQYVSETDFWQWVDTGWWGVKSVNEEPTVAENENNFSRENANKTSFGVLQDIENQGQKNILAEVSENNPNKEYTNTSNYFKMPQLYQTASESANLALEWPIYPEYEWDTENSLYHQYIMENMIAMSQLILGGLSCVLATFPYWWQRYQRDW